MGKERERKKSYVREIERKIEKTRDVQRWRERKKRGERKREQPYYVFVSSPFFYLFLTYP